MGKARSSQEDLKAASDFTGTVHTFGYGSDHNPNLLKEISQAENGMYFFIDTDEKIPESFALCVRGLLSTVAKKKADQGKFGEKYHMFSQRVILTKTKIVS